MARFSPDEWRRHNRSVLLAHLSRLGGLLDRAAGKPPRRQLPVPESRLLSTIDKLVHVFDLEPFERDLLLLAAGVEFDAETASACAAAQGDPQWTRPTVGLALSVLDGAVWSALGPSARLRDNDLIRLDKATEFVRSPLGVDEAMLHFLLDGVLVDPELDGVIKPLHQAATVLPDHIAVADRIVTAWTGAEPERPLVHLLTRDMADAISTLALVGEQLDQPVWRIDAGALPHQPAPLRALYRRWRRLARLLDGVGVLELPDRPTPETLEAVSRFAFMAEEPLAILGPDARLPGSRPRLTLELPRPDAAARERLWHDALTDAMGISPDPDPVQRLAQTFDLDIANLCGAASLAAAPDDDADDDDQQGHHPRPSTDWLPAVWAACRQQARTRLDGLAQRVGGDAGWDSLIVPPALSDSLRDLAAQIRHRTLVHQTWGMAPPGERGMGITALFAGGSGTGKTLAAEILATELNLDLYRVDLSAVVSKYIGETEKNLARIFDGAEAGGCVLLFDEADALFGKRGEVKDSHDRHANMEVGFLLQRMESYRGLAILTTNLRDNMDPAFLRRLRFVLDFPFPDAALREQLWQRALPDRVPMQGVDRHALARLALSGGQIRVVALNAAFAAAADGGVLRPAHLLAAVRREYAKQGRPMSDSEVRLFT